MNYYFCIFILIIGLGVQQGLADSQLYIPKELEIQKHTSTSTLPPTAISSGMEASDILNRFGRPDKKVIESVEGRESWYYGGAVIFFSDGVVSAWSDNGVLKDRLALARIQGYQGGDVDVLYKGGWLNAWTPQDALSRQAILEEVITD